jgi:soluble lytic murein transglycosylase-like protein
LKIPEKEVYDICKTISIKHDIDPKVIYAIIELESSRDPNAVSSSNAIGLMQLKSIAVQDVNLFFNKKFTDEDLYNPTLNIEIGTLYIKRWKLTFQNKGYSNELSLFYAILTYAWGYGNVTNWLQGFNSNEWIKQNIPPEKREYNEKLMWWYNYAVVEFEHIGR